MTLDFDELARVLGPSCIALKPAPKRLVPLRNLVANPISENRLEQDSCVSVSMRSEFGMARAMQGTLIGPVGSIRHQLADSGFVWSSSQSSAGDSVVIRCHVCIELELAFILMDQGPAITAIVPKSGSGSLDAKSCIGLPVQLSELVMVSDSLAVASGCKVL